MTNVELPGTIDGVLDEAYERLHATGPEFQAWLSNHGPMAAESLVRGGHATLVHSWVDRYVRRLDEAPRAVRPIEGDEWEEALGDPTRTGDWIALLTSEVAERAWSEVLATWWPRLLPGIAAASTHGVIRVGHAVRVLREAQTEPRIQELAHGLGYWAARWQPTPGADRRRTRIRTAMSLDAVPRIPENRGGFRSRVRRLGELPEWPEAVASVPPTDGWRDVPARLEHLVHAATTRYLTHGQGNAIMLVHAATAPMAVLRTLPSLPPALWEPSLAYAWAATAAITSVYSPAEALTSDRWPRPPQGTDAGREILARAAEHGDEHVIKLADTAVEVHQRTGAPDVLAAALRGIDLIGAD